MAKTLDKRFEYESRISGVAEFCDSASLALLYINTTDVNLRESSETKTLELWVNLDESELAKSLRSMYYTIVHTGMSPIRGTEEEDTTIVEDWPVAREFEGIASEECITFCNSRGLISSLRSCLEAAKRFFSNRKRLTAELDYFQDEGTEDEGHVVIRLVLESSPETAFREYRSWVEWFVASIEPDHRNLFTLTFTRRST